MKAHDITLLEFPKCSQDLNPVKIAWREVRARLAITEPQARESRQTFIKRVRNAVAWVNRNRAAYVKTLCTCQKAWARDIQESKGARTKH